MESKKKIVLKIQKIVNDLPIPDYAHPGDAGLDLFSNQDIVLKPFERQLVSTGIKISIPVGYAGFVQPKSGRALKEGLSIVNTPGLIDSGYRGEVGVILINLNPDKKLHIKRGEKIAQMVIQKVEEVDVLEVQTLEESKRGEGGFGSTGV